MRWADAWQKPLYYAFLTLFCLGLIGGLFIAPSDYQQGDAYRIIFIHVPAAFLSLFIYSIMAFSAVLLLVWQIKLAELVIKVSAPIGAMVTFLALITGSIWGKPMWGTWWIWDARLTSELILLFLYLGLVLLSQALDDKRQGGKILAIITLVGFVDLPIIHYSVNWWNTLHQGSTLLSFKKPSIASSMLWPLLTMMAAFVFYYVSQLVHGLSTRVLWQERKSRWVRDRLEGML
jgi:heme exporter protein C